MSTQERPMVYDHDDAGDLVYRPMTDEELAQWEEDRAAFAAEEEAAARPTLLRMVDELTPAELAELRELLE